MYCAYVRVCHGCMLYVCVQTSVCACVYLCRYALCAVCCASHMFPVCTGLGGVHVASVLPHIVCCIVHVCVLLACVCMCVACVCVQVCVSLCVFHVCSMCEAMCVCVIFGIM